MFICLCTQAADANGRDQDHRGVPPGWADRLFEQKTYDFGRVPAKAHAEFDFPITNIYPFEIEISRVRYTCECTEPILHKTVLGPGEQTNLTARLRTERFQGRKGATLTVTFVRPEFAEVQLHVTAYIDPAVSLEPAELDFGTLQPGQKASQEAHLTCTNRPDWRIETLRSPNQRISASLTQIERSGQQVRYRLQVHLEAAGPLGPFKEVLVLQTNDPQNAEIPVLVTGRVATEVEVYPPVLWLGVLQPGQKTSKILVLRAQRPFTLRSGTADLPDLSVETPKNTQAQTLWRVTVRYQAPSRPGKHQGILRLQTDLGTQTLEIPVQAMVLASEEK